MNYEITLVDSSEYQELVDLWEASVRASHDFLSEEDIQYFKPLILNTYLDAVDLRCIRDEEERILGFSGVAEHNLEMLFIRPDQRAKGIGKALLEYAIREQELRKVDVNEQNPKALAFYEHCGFTVQSRSEQDGSAKPYPILHMILEA